MKLTDTWANSLYLTHLFFLYLQTAKAKLERVFIRSKTLIYRAERFYMIHSLTTIKSCRKSKKIQRGKSAQPFLGNAEGLYQFMFKEMLFSPLQILSPEGWNTTFIDRTDRNGHAQESPLQDCQEQKKLPRTTELGQYHQYHPSVLVPQDFSFSIFHISVILQFLSAALVLWLRCFSEIPFSGNVL